jgi:leucyl aminopeptidase
MEVQLFSVKLKSKTDADLLVLPFYQEKKGCKTASHFAIPDAVKPALSSGDFSGKEGEMLLVYSSSKAEKRILLIGLGEKSRDAGPMRACGAALAKFCRQKKWISIAIAFQDLDFAEGLLLAAYVFDALKGTKEEASGALQKVYFEGADKGFQRDLDRLNKVVEAVNFTRDLVNANADDMNADRLVEEARSLAKHSSMKITILRKKELEAESMGLILAVNRASPREPALVMIEYRGQPKVKGISTALIGKGVVYDTGGLALKTSGMETMKCDMSGAGVVLGILKAAAALKLPVNLLGVLSIVENSIGPTSYKMGDVYKSRSGKTVEITNTDAEGRLVLADAISYAQDKYEFSHMIDFATLTGGVVIALGEEYSGLYCNDDKLAKALEGAGEACGEKAWRLPLAIGYKEMLKSKVGDLKNAAASRKASPCVGAAFIETFVKEGQSWAHLDIAGTSFLEDPKGWNSSNATGYGVRLLIEHLSKK